MKQYLDMLEHIMLNGEKRKDRTGTGTLSVFGYQTRYDLRKGFPIMTTKKVPFRVVFQELMWFLRGQTNVRYLLDEGVDIWNPDAYRNFRTKVKGMDERYHHLLNMSEETYITQVKIYHDFAKEFGELGPIYGKQWREWGADYERDNPFESLSEGIDQIANVIKSIKEDPFGRRHIVTAWNPSDLEDMALPPCHTFMQFYVSTKGELSCQLYQRSADCFLGVPFNITSYALLIHLVAKQTGLRVGEFVHTIGDAHIYLNHLDQVKLQLSRTPKELPQLSFKEGVEYDDISGYEFEDVELIGYRPDSTIRGKVSVGK